ncbi:hypothetical protein AZE42_04182 [Rhizopogon vesiculosus]|uniref:Non-specific serine/threonine protein kinase n=1 Tax=Rhizopogon vesiculosus TaxID=180088 RepID=A0A1J8Q158_9AGAM|nr:hypothetical protein AZE42_04182 [Rhizopogon vesiculosus]
MELGDRELPDDLSHLITKISQDAVAQGSFGDVWKCSLCHQSRNVEIDVAVKVLRILPHDEGGKEDIRREMGLWKRMRHKHIVPFFGVANTFVPSRISLVSPWQSNGTLTSLLERKHDMNCKDRLLLLHDIASGLLHSENVIHGDLTGFNVLIDTDGHARLTDFGLSSLVNAGEGLTYLAVTTGRPGALRWVAPELVVKDNNHIAPTFGSDIYSFGSVMLQTLSGRLPWSEIKNSHVIIIKLYEECLPQRPDSLPILDAHWDFIMLCMNLVVESRPVAVEVVKWVKEAISSWNGNTGAEAKKLSPLPSLHHRMLLNNFLQIRCGSSAGARVRWEIWATGAPHAPTWYASVYVDDMKYGEGISSTKGGAIDIAARQAVESLNREGNVVAS